MLSNWTSLKFLPFGKGLCHTLIIFIVCGVVCYCGLLFLFYTAIKIVQLNLCKKPPVVSNPLL